MKALEITVKSVCAILVVVIGIVGAAMLSLKNLLQWALSGEGAPSVGAALVLFAIVLICCADGGAAYISFVCGIFFILLSCFKPRKMIHRHKEKVL